MTNMKEFLCISSKNIECCCCIFKPDKPYIQKLFRPVSPEGDLTTLEDLLKEILPQALPSPGNRQVIDMQ